MTNKTEKISTHEIIEMLALGTAPETGLLNSAFENLPTIEPSMGKKQLTLDRLRKSLSTNVTFGELVSRHVSEKSLNFSELAKQLDVPEQTIQSLAKDTILPFTVPVVLMKQFIEHLGIQFDVALKGLDLTSTILADAIFEDQDFTMKAGVSARRGYEISFSGMEPKIARDRASVLQSNERYLRRLKELHQ